MKKLLISLVVMGFALCANAQESYDPYITKATTKINKEDYQGAINILQEGIDKELAKLPEKQKNGKLAEYYNKQGQFYLQYFFFPELTAASQQMPVDTAVFVSSVDASINAYLNSHEYDTKRNAKGKYNGKFITDNRQRIEGMLDYYNYAAMFLYQNKDINGAKVYFKKYIDLKSAPVFSEAQSDSIYQSKKANYDQAAFNIVYLYYQEQDWNSLLSVLPEAKKNEESLHDVYVMQQAANLAMNDTVAWIATTKEAILNVADNTNFQEQLISYYNQHNDGESAKALAEEIIAKDPNSKTAWYMKGCVEFNIDHNYAAARESFQKALEIDPDYVEANMNCAYTYMNEVMVNRQNNKYKYAFRSSYTKAEAAAYQKELAEIQSFYSAAKPYAEKARELNPDGIRTWGSALSMIYANLNMKKEAEEVDELLRQEYNK